MAIEGTFQALSLLQRIAEDASQLRTRRRQSIDTKDVENELLGLLVGLFAELRFCQDVRDNIREFQARFKLAFASPLPTSADQASIANEVRKWFHISIADNLGYVTASKRQQTGLLDIDNIEDSYLRDALKKAAVSYDRMIGSIEEFLQRFPFRLDQFARSQLHVLDFSISTIQTLEDIHDYQLASVSAFIHLGSLIARLIRE